MPWQERCSASIGAFDRDAIRQELQATALLDAELHRQALGGGKDAGLLALVVEVVGAEGCGSHEHQQQIAMRRDQLVAGHSQSARQYQRPLGIGRHEAILRR